MRSLPLLLVSAIVAVGCGDVQSATQPYPHPVPNEGRSFTSPDTQYLVLHNFQNRLTNANVPDGSGPIAGLLRDPIGNLFGTTTGGGFKNFGAVFEIDTSGDETMLHSFSGPDGEYPGGPLIRDTAGNLYGTTEFGGTGFPPGQNGVVFTLDPSGNEKVLHNFNATDGTGPQGVLLRDSAGNIYGTTNAGGSGSSGVVYKLDTNGTLSVIHNFNRTDGAHPLGGVIRDSAGNFYGATLQGGPTTCSCGVIFKIDAGGDEIVLHAFSVTDGAYPAGGVIMDKAGNLYGTTVAGGTLGKGVAFRLAPSGALTVLHSFGGDPDGSHPLGGLVRDWTGNLYGTTYRGGVFDKGTIFKLDSMGNMTVLHSFNDASGKKPWAGLIRDSSGTLFGTTAYGGSAGNGVVFEVTP